MSSVYDVRLTPLQYLKGSFVNIYDFVDAQKKSQTARMFTTDDALADYSIRNDKIFPLRRAKENPILRWMLIRIFH